MVKGVTVDEVDLSIAQSEMDMMILVKQVAIRSAKDEKALKNIEYPRFCIDCENLIPYERLRAVPTTSRCVNCQSLYEEKLL